MNVLCIGNSFSVDGTRYLHGIARAAGDDINTTNLNIGGCPLDKHYRNMLSDAKAYFLDINGNCTWLTVSLSEGLLNRQWDVVTIQQVSHKAPYYKTYQPYLNELCDYIRECSPEAKLLIQQTWAYEEGSERLTKELGYEKQEDMFKDIKEAYDKAAKDVDAELIPSGQVFQELIKEGIGPVHCDTFHASKGIGRFALGLIWYRVLTGKDVTDINFTDFDEPIDPETVKKIKECVMRVKI